MATLFAVAWQAWLPRQCRKGGGREGRTLSISLISLGGAGAAWAAPFWKAKRVVAARGPRLALHHLSK